MKKLVIHLNQKNWIFFQKCQFFDNPSEITLLAISGLLASSFTFDSDEARKSLFLAKRFFKKNLPEAGIEPRVVDLHTKPYPLG